MSRVAVIGVGRIGLPVCACLIRAGHTVVAVDVDPDREALAAAVGARVGLSAESACQQAELVLTVLPGGPELRDLMLGDGSDGSGLLGRFPAGVDWIDLTSAGPQLGRELAAAAASAGVAALDSPLGGGVSAAENGTLTLIVGGDIDLLDRWRPVLQSLAVPGGAGRILHQGPAGTGYLTKLLVNQLWFGQALATAEVMLLGQAGGLDLPGLREVLIDGPAGSRFIADHLPAVFEGDYLPAFGLDRVVEELDSIRAEAARHDLPFELSGLVADVHTRALARFGPVDGELLGVAYLEGEAGRTLRTGPSR